MCGITGILSDQPNRYISPMSRAIAHRGPDGDGVWSAGRAALAHRRLAIQDTSPAGHQPMFSEDGNYVMVFNGEIYNHREIRAGLSTRHQFRSKGDSETLLYAYIEQGPAVFSRLNGIFAAAIYHIPSGDLLLVRDHFGVKPLYYAVRGEAFLFGSEVKALMACPLLRPAPDPVALANYLSLMWTPGASTVFEGVSKLLPGHYLKVNAARPTDVVLHRYYELPFDGRRGEESEAEWAKALEEHLLQAVERQLLSDVPVGFFLSGGLDSSAIVALARKLRPHAPLRCYTIDTGTAKTTADGFSSDLPYAQQVAAHLQADLQLVPGGVDIVRDFDQMIWHSDAPQADPAAFHVSNICAQARRDGYVVLLGGAGGDDLFSGYRRHQVLYWDKWLALLPPFAGRLAKAALARLDGRAAFVRRARKLVEHWNKPPLERMAAHYLWLDPGRVRSLFAPNMREKLDTFDPVGFLLEALKAIPDEQDPLNQMLFWELKYFLGDHNLLYTDAMSMAHGVEVRVPFLDQELVAFSATLPVDLKMKGTTTKYLLRKVMEPYLPKNVIYRPKAGFGAPVRQWIAGELAPLVAEYLESGGPASEWFDRSALRQLIADNQTGKTDAAYPILGLLAIHKWYQSEIQNLNSEMYLPCV